MGSLSTIYTVNLNPTPEVGFKLLHVNLVVDFKLYRWFALPPCWCTKQKKICSQSLHKNGGELPEEKNLIVPVHEHGRHDVSCQRRTEDYKSNFLITEIRRNSIEF